MKKNSLNFSQLIIEATKEFQQPGTLDKAIPPLIAAVSQNPFARGAADAIGHIVGIQYAIESYHYGEMTALLVYRLRSTLIERKMLFNSLVNLAHFNLGQKSFDEAFAYGTIAERIWPDDEDLLANMVFACAMTGREEEAIERFEQVKRIAPIKAGALASYFEQDSPHFRRTRDDDCSAIKKQLQEIFELKKTSRSVRVVDTGSQDLEFGAVDDMKQVLVEEGVDTYGEELVLAVRELERHPDGIQAHECWCLLCEIYAAELVGIHNEYLQLQTWAGLAAASGKALNTKQSDEGDNIKLLRWHGRALSQLCLYELAIDPLKKATLVNDRDSDDQVALDRCMEMLLREEKDPARPDSPRFMGLLDYHLPRTTPDASNGVLRKGLNRLRKAEDLLSEARQLARTRNGFWEAYNLFDRALAELPKSDQPRLDRCQELNLKAYRLFEVNKDEAVALLCEAVALVASSAENWQELGSIRFSQGGLAEAEEFQERAIEIMERVSTLPPDGGRFWVNMARGRLCRAESDSSLSVEERQAKLDKAEEEARFAASVGDGRGHSILQKISEAREVLNLQARGGETKPWWKVW